jgi:hypothetical protein
MDRHQLQSPEIECSSVPRTQVACDGCAQRNVPCDLMEKAADATTQQGMHGCVSCTNCSKDDTRCIVYGSDIVELYRRGQVVSVYAIYYQV